MLPQAQVAAPAADFIVWCNLTTCGVVPAGKLEFVLSETTRLLQAFPTVGVAVIILPNRSSCDDITSTPKPGLTAGTVAMSKEEHHSGSDRDSDAEGCSDKDVEMELRTVQNQVEEMFGQKQRGLRTRLFQLVYDVSTIYGQREAVAPALAITANSQAGNHVWNSSIWRLKVTKPMVMLGRDKMIKPKSNHKQVVPLGVHFTDPQERKQHHSSTEVCDTILNGLLDGRPDVHPTIIVDLHAYDGAPACCAVERTAAGRQTLLANIAHDLESAQCVTDRVGALIYSMGRAKKLQLAGFPDFDPTLNELKTLAAPDRLAQVSYKVCQQLPSGGLAVLDVHQHKWAGHAVHGDAMAALMAKHNAEFNKDNLTASGVEEREPQPGDVPADEPALKRRRLECNIKDVADLKTKFTDMCPHFDIRPSAPRGLLATLALLLLSALALSQFQVHVRGRPPHPLRCAGGVGCLHQLGLGHAVLHGSRVVLVRIGRMARRRRGERCHGGHRGQVAAHVPHLHARPHHLGEEGSCGTL